MARQNRPDNRQIATVLNQIADLLETKKEDPYRINAYRRAARTVERQEKPVYQIVDEEGQTGLATLPSVGSGIAGLIDEYVRTGQSKRLERLKAEVSPEVVLTKIPGITPALAKKIHDDLQVNTLEELEQAAHDGRLSHVEGFTPNRIIILRIMLEQMLSSAERNKRVEQKKRTTVPDPPVHLLLEIDREYREKAGSGELIKIAPKRFNPENEAWLPVFQTQRAGWRFTALFSNTRLAHDLNKTNDWVVIYYEINGRESQHTVVTGTSGNLRGMRVVRGREAETEKFYQTH